MVHTILGILSVTVTDSIEPVENIVDVHTIFEIVSIVVTDSVLSAVPVEHCRCFIPLLKSCLLL